ncbi:MAG: hypothetical protein ACHRXM_08255 [Isosphaerales bacterium]
MFDRLRLIGAAAVSAGLVGLALASGTSPQGPPARPRPGLTAQQTKEAVNLAKGAMRELRKKTEGASTPGADLREYIVGVELLAPKETAAPATKEAAPPAEGDEPSKTKAQEKEGEEKQEEKEKRAGPLAIVTSYRYFDDITVFSTINLGTGRVVKVEAAQHLRTPLSDTEFEEARDLAREKSNEVKRLYERFGDQLSVYPQFSQFNVKDDPRINRVVHLTYRLGKRDLSYPRPQVNLTTREVETPAPEADVEPKARRRSP